MSNFLFSYDLNNEGKGYKKSSSELRSALPKLRYVFSVTELTDSTFLLATIPFATIDNMFSALRGLLDNNDEFVLAEVSDYRCQPKPVEPIHIVDKLLADAIARNRDQKPSATAGAF